LIPDATDMANYTKILQARFRGEISKEEAMRRIEEFEAALNKKHDKLPCGHERMFERADATPGKTYCLKCVTFEKKLGPDRAHYHRMLDQAMDESKEGESFLPRFVALIINELRSPK